ncbi:MAG: hypothetical protein AB1505_27170, partial [Candidatus Latescibacterota bacterium]
MAIALLFLAGLALYTYPLIRDLTCPFSPPGDYLLITYSLAWQWHALWHHPGSLFDANVMYPADNALAIATPLNTSQLLFFGPALEITGDPIVAINAVHLGNILASALSAYWVLRRYAASRSAALVGAWIFAFSLGKLHQNFQFPFFWLVWSFHFWHQFLLRLDWRWLAAAVLSFVLLSLGSFYLMYMALFGLTTWTLGFHWRVRSLLDRRFLVRAALGGAVATVLLLPFGWPYFGVSRTYGLKRPLGEVIQYSADPIASYLLPNNRSVLYASLDWSAGLGPLPGEESLFGVAAGLVGRMAGPSVLGDRYGDGLSYRDFQSIWVSGEGERRLFPGYSVVLLAVLSLFSKAPT